MEIVLIAAVAEDRTIGDEGEMPWFHEEDLAHFKETTMGSPVIIGRRTYEAIVKRLGAALPGRTSIVLSSQPRGAIVDEELIPGDSQVVVVGSVDEAIETAADHGDIVFVAGGRTIYEQFLPRADRMIITEVPGRFGGDTRFPHVAWNNWTEVSREAGDEVTFVEYRHNAS